MKVETGDKIEIIAALIYGIAIIGGCIAITIMATAPWYAKIIPWVLAIPIWHILMSITDAALPECEI